MALLNNQRVYFVSAMVPWSHGQDTSKMFPAPLPSWHFRDDRDPLDPLAASAAATWDAGPWPRTAGRRCRSWAAAIRWWRCDFSGDGNGWGLENLEFTATKNDEKRGIYLGLRKMVLYKPLLYIYMPLWDILWIYIYSGIYNII